MTNDLIGGLEVLSWKTPVASTAAAPDYNPIPQNAIKSMDRIIADCCGFSTFETVYCVVTTRYLSLMLMGSHARYGVCHFIT